MPRGVRLHEIILTKNSTLFNLARSSLIRIIETDLWRPMRLLAAVLCLILFSAVRANPSEPENTVTRACLTALEEAAKILAHGDLQGDILNIDSLELVDDLRCHEEEKMVNTVIIASFHDRTIKFAVLHLHLTKEGMPHPQMPPRKWKPYSKEDLRLEWCGLMRWREESLREQKC